jgi:hypothetical protein
MAPALNIISAGKAKCSGRFVTELAEFVFETIKLSHAENKRDAIKLQKEEMIYILMKISRMSTDVEQQSPDPESIFNNLVDLELYEKSLKNARTWLYVIAAFQFLMGVYEYFTVEDNVVAAIAFGIDAFIGLTFLALAIWSKKKPTIAFALALGLYVLFLISFMILDSSNIFKGVIIKILVIVALVKANRDARKYEEVKASIVQS